MKYIIIIIVYFILLSLVCPWQDYRLPSEYGGLYKTERYPVWYGQILRVTSGAQPPEEWIQEDIEQIEEDLIKYKDSPSIVELLQNDLRILKGKQNE